VTAVTQMNLRTVRSPERAVDLLRLLGYESRALPYDLRALGLDGAPALRLNSDRSPSRGYGVLVAELDRAPRSLRSFGRRLVEQFHDRPLAFVGVRNGGGDWRELLVLRPRLIEGGGGAVALRKLTIDVEHPTSHDAEVMRGLRWDSADEPGSQTRIDSALDVERVTRRFFEGLSEHHDRLLEAVRQTAAADSAMLAGLERAGGSERVALRIVTQILFCYFVQRKGLLEGERGWLSLAFQRNVGHGDYYQRVLEPLFYDALSTPLDERSEEWRRQGIPFLNGGLFERHYGDVSLPLPDELFSTDEGLLGFLDRWTFTVAEEAANESEVAVDPEMLGRVFENLISEDEMRREGTVYTPRPVVQFMCRESLVPYLVRKADIEENEARELLVDDDAFDHVAERAGAHQALALARRVDHAVEELHALDPAVGSGAFLLGLMTELVRLRRLAHLATDGGEPAPVLVREWRMHLIERSLFGVDVNPTAIELCRLRLWLSLIVDEHSGTPHPLPNLEYRTVSGDSLTDFVGGVEVQQTRAGEWTLGLDLADPAELVALRERYFEASDPVEKQRLRAELEGIEEAVVETIFERVDERARQPRRNRRAQEQARATLESVPGLRARFSSRDRVFPAFLPSFSAPDVVKAGGWDVVIMNPPYVGRKLVRERFDAGYLADLELHYGRTYDLMIHFGKRAFELAHPEHGIVSMIFNDSIFTSTDADDFRRQLFDPNGRTLVLAAARTRCFEGKAVNGGVIVATRDRDPDEALRWSENHGRPPADLAGASMPAEVAEGPYTVGRSELWVVPRSEYRRLPHRPLFRPSEEARTLLGAFEACAAWDELSRWDAKGGGDWPMLSETARLEEWKQAKRSAGFYGRLRSQERFVLLGLTTVGGVGLQTGEDRRFLAAIEGTAEAHDALQRQGRLAALAMRQKKPAARLHELESEGLPLVEALLVVSEEFHPRTELGWPKGGLIRVASASEVRTIEPGSAELESGIKEGPSWVPFIKGDASTEAGAAKWWAPNPYVIDWSEQSVTLLRERARQTGGRKAYFKNRQLYGKAGASFNKIGSYLRARLIPPGAIFGDAAPVLIPDEQVFNAEELVAFLNSYVVDFCARTFLTSRMNIHVGDLRKLPLPVLSSSVRDDVCSLARRAAAIRQETVAQGGDASELTEVEAELDGIVRRLYCVRGDADLWVVR
jgi:Eco57I restriction-modification methylase